MQAQKRRSRQGFKKLEVVVWLGETRKVDGLSGEALIWIDEALRCWAAVRKRVRGPGEPKQRCLWRTVPRDVDCEWLSAMGLDQGV